MFGPLVLLTASIAPAFPPAGQGTAGFQPTGSATAHATVSIRIVSGVRFGENQLEGAETASRRKGWIKDPNGLARPADLLEFQ